jgi:uncharacterized membrane protein
MTMPNDWKIKKCLRLSLVILVSLLGLIGIETLGFDIPILRQVVGFLFLAYIPGMLILRIIKIHNIGIVESLLYSVALSIAFIYFVGLFNNSILPLISFTRPISLFPVTISLIFFTFILGVIAYLRDKDFTPPDQINHFSKKETSLSPYLLLVLLPILAVLGTSLVNTYQDNRVLIILLVLIAVVVALVVHDKLLQSAYPLTIVMIAISIMFLLSLISPTLFGSDIQREYYFQNLVLQNGYWDSAIPNNYNTCLSIVLLCPIYSLLLNIDGVWVFKIVYSILFSIIPLTLFCIYKEQIGAKKAFLSSFFYMTTPTLVEVMITHARQEIAELFLVLLILLIVDKKLKPTQKSTLAIVFSLSLPLSHYATAYFSIALFGIGWFFLFLMKNHNISDIWKRLSQKFNLSPANSVSNALNQDLFRPSLLAGSLICLLTVFSLSWYMYTARGEGFNAIVGVGKSVFTGLAEFLEPTTRETVVKTALGEGFLRTAILDKAFFIFQYLIQFFIIAGFFVMLFSPQRYKFRPEYISLNIGVALNLFACIILPYFSSNISLIRFYILFMLFLAPLCIIGSEAVWQGISRLFKLFNLSSNNSNKANNPAYLIFLTLAILIPYFLFTSNFFYAFSSRPASIALGPYKMNWFALFNQKEVNAATWLSESLPNGSEVYVDASGRFLLYQYFNEHVYNIKNAGNLPNNVYIFLGTWNIEYKEFFITVFQGVTPVFAPVHLMNRPVLADRINNSMVIYNNGGSKILAPME